MNELESARFHWVRATEETNHANNRVTWAALLQIALLSISKDSQISPIWIALLGTTINSAAFLGYYAASQAASELMDRHDAALRALDSKRTEEERRLIPIAIRGRGGGRRVWHRYGIMSSWLIIFSYYVVWFAVVLQ